MELYGTGSMGAYLRKMAIDGYVIKLELAGFVKVPSLGRQRTSEFVRV